VTDGSSDAIDALGCIPFWRGSERCVDALKAVYVKVRNAYSRENSVRGGRRQSMEDGRRLWRCMGARDV